MPPVPPIPTPSCTGNNCDGIPKQTDESGQECDVAFLNTAWTKCPAFTQIGPRSVNFCTEFATTNASISSQIDNLNAALNNCKKNNLDIANFDINGLTSLEIQNIIYSSETAQSLKESIIEFQKVNTLPNQKSLENYIQCRNNAFINNGLASLQSASEKDVNSWILSKISTSFDNDYSQEYYDTSNPNIKIINQEKMYYSTLNQANFSEFWDNSFRPRNQGTFIDVSQMDKLIAATDLNNFINSLSDSKWIQRLNDYSIYLNKLSPIRKNVDVLLSNWNDHKSINKDHYINSSYIDSSDVSCNSEKIINICMAYGGSDGSCRSCLSPDTSITMADGTTRPIKTLKEGDMVKTPYSTKEAKIIEIVKIDWPELQLYNINQGKLKLTADHPVMTKKGGWKAINYNSRGDQMGFKRYGVNEVPELKIGDVIIMQDGAEMEVTHILPENPIKDGVTYNLKLEEGASSFYANGILVKSQK